MRWSPPTLWASVLASFLVVAALQAWPLPRHISTHVTGSPGNDTGTYLWNLWIFRHELIDIGSTPFSTEAILPLDGPTDLSLHNYTVAADLAAAVLLPMLGLVATFNVIYLVNVALAGFGVFALTRSVHRIRGPGVAEAWLAGLLFACSPFLVARSTAHFSLVAAAPLPFFVLFFERAWQRHRARHAAAAGACLAWAAFSDPYYAIYCAMLGGLIVMRDSMAVRPAEAAVGHGRLRTMVDVLLVTAAVFVGLIAVLDLPAVHIGRVSLSIRSLYTPVFILTVLVWVRVLLSVRHRLDWAPVWTGRDLATVAGILALVTGVLLAPQLAVLVVHAAEGRLVRAPVPWRSSAAGLDVLALLLPNPNHPLAPSALVNWFAHQPGHYEENVASIPWIALAVIAWGWRIHAAALDRFWRWVVVFFAALSLGPFVRVAGIATYIPTPWTLLRYVPLLGEARMPPRFGIVVILGVAVLFAGALSAIAGRYPHRRRLILTAIGLALAFELLPAPRTLYSAEIPAIYQTIARDPAPVRVLELPFGVRDGLSSLGDFDARSLFHQTRHHKTLIGGATSRVAETTKEFYASWPFVRALMDLSEPTSSGVVDPALREAGSDFVERANLGYVVMNTARTSQALRDFAIASLHLTPRESADGYELFTPRREVSPLRTTPASPPAE